MKHGEQSHSVEWTPVDTGLPEPHRWVLVTQVRMAGPWRVSTAYRKRGEWLTPHYGVALDGVIAWAPLPEPYSVSGLEARE